MAMLVLGRVTVGAYGGPLFPTHTFHGCAPERAATFGDQLTHRLTWKVFHLLRSNVMVVMTVRCLARIICKPQKTLKIAVGSKSLDDSGFLQFF